MYKELVESTGGIYHSNRIIPSAEISTAPSDKERYCSMFTFDKAMLDYVKVNKTVTDFDGVCYANVFWIDIDVKGNLEQAKIQTAKFITRLNKVYQVDPNDLFIYFSGGKGFHIALHSKLFGEFKPSKYLPKQFKQLALALAGDIKVDTAIYEPVRLFRIANSKHSSGLYKIEVSFDEIALPIEYITGLAKTPRIDFQREKSINQLFKNNALETEWLNAQNYSGEVEQLKTDVGFWQPDKEGNRHHQLYRQAAMLFDKSELSKQAVYYLMECVNAQCKPPIDDLRELVDSAFVKTSKKRKKEELVLKPFAGWVDQYLDYVFHQSSQMTTGFPSFDHALRHKLKGQLCCKIGYGGSKKSLSSLNTAMMNIQNHDCNVIYSTMEMSVNKLIDRLIDYIVDGELTNASYELEKMVRSQADSLLRERIAPMLGTKLMMSENGSLTCKDYENLIERTINETGKLDMLVVDGLSMMGGADTEVQRYSDNTKELKELANKYNIYIELICHVSKGADWHTRDLTDKVRGSEKIFDNCDFTITFSQLIDFFAISESTEYLKDKGYVRFYDKRGSGQTINKIYKFNKNKLTLEETNENPADYEGGSKKKNAFSYE